MKSEIAWSGSERHCLTQMGKLFWIDVTKKSVKTLNIHYTYCQGASDKLIFDKVINKFVKHKKFVEMSSVPFMVEKK